MLIIKRPLSFLAVTVSAVVSLFLAVIIDTDYYRSTSAFSLDLRDLVLTPWNNLVYNFDSANLAEHGTHPYYQHILINLPQLLGPTFPLLFIGFTLSNQLYSALSAIVVLSCFSHQEARFLVPAVPLLLSSVKLPSRFAHLWVAAWLVFNLALGILMGVFHQGGIVPAQLWLSTQDQVHQIFWWKTLSPPNYLLGSRGAAMQTYDLMGMPGKNMTSGILDHVNCDSASHSILVAPHSATFLDDYLRPVNGAVGATPALPFTLEHIWSHRAHLNMNDIEPLEEGMVGTWNRVIGRRGVGIWKIYRQC